MQSKQSHYTPSWTENKCLKILDIISSLLDFFIFFILLFLKYLTIE